MSVTYNSTLKGTRMDAVVAAVDQGASAGKLKIGTAAMATTLVTITLDDPSFTRSGAVITMAGAPKSGTASASGTAAAAIITDSNDVTIVSGLTVGTTLTDIVLDTTAITNGQTITITSGTLTHA
jgi:hypothetical protein